MSMPVPLLNAYAEQLPKLVAEESLHAAERTAVGSGTLKRSAARTIIGAWQRQVDAARVTVRPQSAAAYDALMRASGIGVHKVKRSDG